MKKIAAIFVLTFFALLSACEKDKNPEIKTDPLKERFHGKYKILQARSNQDVDINMDGVSSRNLLTEIPDLEHAYLELLFRKKINIFALFWPEQYLSYEADKNNPFIMYASQSYPFNFIFNSDQSQLIITASPSISAEDAARYVVTQSVRIIANDRIQISFTKKIYTKQGFQNINVELTYERWTTNT